MANDSTQWLGELECAIGKLRSTYSLNWQKMTGDQIADMDCAIAAVQNVIDTERSHSLHVEFELGRNR
jgi:hypothetical protein